jgi:hypothetical protein
MRNSQALEEIDDYLETIFRSAREAFAPHLDANMLAERHARESLLSPVRPQIQISTVTLTSFHRSDLNFDRS